MAGRTVLRVFVAPGTLRGVGLVDITEQAQVGFTATNPPQKLQAGESVLDNKPAGVPVYTAATFNSSTDIWTLLRAIEADITSPGYVDLGASTRVINTYQLPAANDWRGYYNGNRKIMGLIGVEGQTFIDEGPNMIPSAARAYALAPSDTTTPVPLQNLYFSNGGTSVPLFFSGITFRGKFQGPYGTVPTSGLTLNTGTAGPIPHRGLSLWNSVAGSRVQFCHFQGFSYSVKASPPYELGMVESNNDNGLHIARSEFDGRLPTGEVSGGGVMVNYGDHYTVEDSWLHHTRRSGFALHEHTGGDAGTYTVDNFQVENIASTSDGFSGSRLGFNASNVEGMTGTMSYQSARFALDGGYHVSLGTTAATAIAQAINVTDFTSLSSAYNGCFVIRIIKNPNSSGTSPYWDLYQAQGLGALPFHVTNGATTLTPVASTAFNSATHNPNSNYVVVTS